MNANLLKDRSTSLIFRDCLKTAKLMAGVNDPIKIRATKNMIKSQFRANVHLTEEEEIKKMRFLAISGMSNYLIFAVKKSEIDNNYTPHNIFTGEEVPEEEQRKDSLPDFKEL